MEPSAQPKAQSSKPAPVGSRDGIGAGDHDQPYRYGHRPTSAWTYPFSSREFAHLLVLRGRVQDGEVVS
jgi:hypothetical protein